MAKLPNDEASLWREYYTSFGYPQLTDDIEVDAVVVGAGITGLTSAYLLKRSGLTVAVLDKGTVAGGTSGRTTGKVTSQHSLTYTDLQERLGLEAARIYGEANQAAVELVEIIVQQERIDCDWVRDDNYVFTTDPNKVEQFMREAEDAHRLGLPVTFEQTTPLPFAVKAAVKFSKQGKFNAQKYLLGLARAINRDGSYVFEHSHVIGIRDGDPCRVRTTEATVIARDVVVATNVPTLPLLARGGYCILEYPTESYIVAGEPDKKIKGMYISPDKDHYSILPIKVNGRQQLLVGGEGGNLPGFRLSKKSRYQRLSHYAQQHFGVDMITNMWSDRDYMAYDLVPLIGKLYPWSKHIYVGTAYRKWGLSNGTVAGMILSDLITGKENAWAYHFRPNRIKPVLSIPRAITQFISG